MTWWIVGIIIVVSLFFSGFFSGAETGLYRLNRLRLHLGVRQNSPSARRLERVLRDEPGALSVTLIGTNVANYATTSAVAYLFADVLGATEIRTELYTVAIVTPVIFVFGEMVPKNLFQLHADTLMARGSHLLVIANRLFRMTGVVWALTGLAGVINRLTGSPAQPVGAFGPKRRIAALLQEALAGTPLFEDQSDLIERVCQLSETPVHAVMIPRNRVTTIAAGADRRELVRLARRTGYGRLPVFESNPRHVVGVVKIDALLPAQDWTTVGDRMRHALTLGPHETVANAMTRLQRAGRGLAVVTDHGGQMLGIVTLKDLLRELVGELAAGV